MIHQLLVPEIPNRFANRSRMSFSFLAVQDFAAKCNFTGCIHIEKLGLGLKHTAYNCGCIVKRLLGNLFPIYPYFSTSVLIMRIKGINQAGNRGLSIPEATAEDNKLTIFYI